MSHLFPLALQEFLRPRSSHLFLLVCGSKPLTEEGYQFMSKWASLFVLIAYGSK